MNKEKADDVRRKLGFDEMYVQESDGRSGGLVLFCNFINKVVLNYSSPSFIDVVSMRGDEVDWRLTGFYGFPAWDQRHLSWTCLRDLHKMGNHRRAIIGDFNEILIASEKEGSNP